MIRSMTYERKYTQALGRTIKLLRGARTQKEVADAAEIPTSTLSKIEQARQIPRDKTFAKIAGGLGLTVSELEQRVAAYTLGELKQGISTGVSVIKPRHPGFQLPRRPRVPREREEEAVPQGRADDAEKQIQSLSLAPPPPPLKMDADRIFRVAGTRVTLDTLVYAYNGGASAEEIAYRYPALELADVYTALPFYLRQRSTVDAYLRQREGRAAAVRQENEVRTGTADFRERLLTSSGNAAKSVQLRLAADENFDHRIVNALLRWMPDLDYVRLHDAGPAGAGDAAVVEWAAMERRVLLTHDASTMTRYAADLPQADRSGVLEISARTPVSRAVEDLVLIVSSTTRGEWQGQVRYVPI